MRETPKTLSPNTMTNTYKGVTYHITRKKGYGWVNSIETPTGIVEDGYFSTESEADMFARRDINSMNHAK